MMSQSLIHQVSVSDHLFPDSTPHSEYLSQSLIHQVSVSDLVETLKGQLDYEEVSIPYSSGLSFR